MDRSTSRKRPWLAALLGVFATGLGHLYLRRWRRAIAWFGILIGVTALFVDPAAVDSLSSGTDVDLEAVAPVLVIGALSVVDAYLLARTHNAVARRSDTSEGQRADCPNCGKELDPTLEFCHWCTMEFDDPAADPDAVVEQKRH